jgi:hypothetical protein
VSIVPEFGRVNFFFFVFYYPMVSISSIFALAGLISAFFVGKDTVNKDTLKRPWDIIAYVMIGLAVVIAIFNTGNNIGRLGGIGGVGGIGGPF